MLAAVLAAATAPDDKDEAAKTAAQKDDADGQSEADKSDADAEKGDAKDGEAQSEGANEDGGKGQSRPEESTDVKKVYVIPIREDIMPPLTYLIRRGVKEAMDADADVLILHMDTFGGRIDVTLEIINIISKFKGETVTFIDSKAISAGSFISAATQRIYMSPEGGIGAAAPVSGSGQDLGETMDAKVISMVKAMIRTQAQRNGHNIDVLEAMIDKDKELIVDGETLCADGELLSLTAMEAERTVGDPAMPMLSLGTYDDLDELIDELGYSGAERTNIEAMGAEKIASWLNAISGILLVIGMGGVWVEMKTPGFGLPGIIGIIAFALFFFGSYAAGLAGMEWMIIFVLGVLLVALELFVFPGTVVLGLTGAGLMLTTIIMSMADYYPGTPINLSFVGQALENSAIVLAQATGGTILMMWALYRFVFPHLAQRHSAVGAMMSAAASGVGAEVEIREEQESRMGQVGETISALRPGGKARFGEETVNVISDGEMIEAGVKVKVIGASGLDAVVEPVEE